MLGLVQETPRRLSPLPLGLGLGVTDQELPFHDSIRVPSMDSPTATQLLGLVQDTLVRPLSLGLGAGVKSASVSPFHDSIRVSLIPLEEDPTATQLTALVQEIPPRSL